VRYLVAHCADAFDQNGKQKVADALRDVLNTPVSPELLPANENGEIAQKTEDLVGPYELHDFYLYHMLRYGTPPAKLYRLAKQALGGTYDDETLKKWLKIFVRRFFNQQFKRSCLPDGPKVGSVGLSPRGDWSMPSDASSALWQAEAELL
jgi:NAD+ synthase (glutamine-hydrolysing)